MLATNPASQTTGANAKSGRQPDSGLLSLLDSRGWILADGATGTNLFAMGLPAGDAPELLNERRPDWVKTIYKGAIAAGAELILTNSFGGNRARLRLHEAEGRTHELCRRSALLARETAAEMGANTIIAGSMGPTGELMAPLGSLTRASAVEIFHEQAEGLKAGGVDAAWIETMSDIGELDCAAEACVLAGLPYCATMSFDSAGRTMMGVGAVELADWACNMSRRPLAYGANCGAGAADLVRTMLEFPAPASGMHLIAKGNAGIPKWVEGHVHYDGTPDLMADYAELAFRSGARIIGGCCGTTPEHLTRMHARLEGFAGGIVPDESEILSKLGQFSGLGFGVPPGRIHRRSRRRRS